MQSNIQFANEKIKESFEKLKEADQKLHKIIEQNLKNIEKNAFYGIQIPKKLIPKEYLEKFNVKNLWKCNLPDAWRLIYSIEGRNLVVFSIILDWMDHKTYEKRFKY